MNWLPMFRNQRIKKYAPSREVWQVFAPRMPMLKGLNAEELESLRETVGLLLAEKSIQGSEGVEISDPVRLIIASQAALLVWKLGLTWYRNWSTVVVYPDEFISRHEWTDSAGVLHEQTRNLVGEARYDGPVILSWAQTLDDAGAMNGGNVVIHEFAHKLDMLNGDTNGFPPLHRGMDIDAWSRAFTDAYEDLSQRHRLGLSTALDPYATSAPSEFFAVCVETFFADPQPLLEHYPLVYEQLRCFLKQDPAARMQKEIAADERE